MESSLTRAARGAGATLPGESMGSTGLVGGAGGDIMAGRVAAEVEGRAAGPTTGGGLDSGVSSVRSSNTIELFGGKSAKVPTT
jgi:hypothetical protein